MSPAHLVDEDPALLSPSRRRRRIPESPPRRTCHIRPKQHIYLTRRTVSCRLPNNRYGYSRPRTAAPYRHYSRIPILFRPSATSSNLCARLRRLSTTILSEAPPRATAQGTFVSRTAGRSVTWESAFCQAGGGSGTCGVGSWRPGSRVCRVGAPCSKRGKNDTRPMRCSFTHLRIARQATPNEVHTMQFGYSRHIARKYS